MMRIRTAVFVAVLALFVRPAGTSAEGKTDNLLKNGGFEDAPEAGDFKPLDKDCADIKGWKVTRGQIDLVGTHWKAAAGKHSLDLNGSPGYGGVAQTFKTTKGQKYRLTFMLSGNPNGSVAKKKLGVKAAGAETSFEFDTSNKNTENMGWEKKTWDFTAEGAETTLEIYSLMAEDESSGPALDEVVVVAVK